jgi:hypothetical protein
MDGQGAKAWEELTGNTLKKVAIIQCSDMMTYYLRRASEISGSLT